MKFQEVITFAPIIMGIVQRCGCYINTISLGQRWSKISQNVIDTVTKLDIFKYPFCSDKNK